MFLKLVLFSSQICIVSNKIRFKAYHHLQYRENVRLYTGCRLDQTLSKCISSFKKVKELKCSNVKDRNALHSSNLTVFLQRMCTKYTYNCDVCHLKDENGVFQFIF